MDDETITPASIGLIAHHARVLHVTHEVTADAMMSPDQPLLHWHVSRYAPDASGDGPIDIPGEGEKTLRFSARETLTAIQRTGHEDLRNDIIATGMILGTLRLADAVDKGGYHLYDEPLLEFLRHYRNACAHGGRWRMSVSKKHGWSKAALRGLELHPDLDGELAVLGTVDRATHLHLLEDVAAYFQTFALRSALKEVHSRYAGRPLDTVREQLHEAMLSRGFDNVGTHAVETYSKMISGGRLFMPKVLPEKYHPIDDLGPQFPRQGIRTPDGT